MKVVWTHVFGVAYDVKHNGGVFLHLTSWSGQKKVILGYKF